MTPDEQHAEYFNRNPYGNHPIVNGEVQPAPKTLELLDELEKKLMGELKEHKGNDSEIHKEMWNEIRGKLSVAMFVGVLTIAMSLVSGMFYLVWNEVKGQGSEINTIKANSSETKADVSYIKGLLDNPKTEITN